MVALFTAIKNDSPRHHLPVDSNGMLSGWAGKHRCDGTLDPRAGDNVINNSTDAIISRFASIAYAERLAELRLLASRQVDYRNTSKNWRRLSRDSGDVPA